MSFDARESSGYLGEPVKCFRFSLGATTWRWTSADGPVTIPDGTFTPEPIDCSEVRQDEEDLAGALEVEVPLNSAVYAPLIGHPPASSLVLTVFDTHRGAEAFFAVSFTGKAASWQARGDSVTIAFLPLGDELLRPVPPLAWQPLCNLPLYGTRCGVNRLSFRDAATVATVSGVTVTATAFAARPAGWYLNGFLEDASGDLRWIVGHTGNAVQLMNPFPALSPGASVFAYAGCARDETTCRVKFNNLARHLGFPRVPAQNPFVGTLDG